MNFDGAGYTDQDAGSSYQCHSCGERVFERYPCSNCGHEFCSKCTTLLNNSNTWQTTQRPITRISKGHVPRTPRPDTISEETDGLYTSSESNVDLHGPKTPEVVHRTISVAAEASPTLVNNVEVRRAASSRSIARNISSMSSFESSRNSLHINAEPRSCPRTESSQQSRGHCICCVAKRSKSKPSETTELKLGATTNRTNWPPVLGRSTEPVDDDSLVPPALQLHHGPNDSNKIVQSYSTMSTNSDLTKDNSPEAMTKTCGLLPHPRTPEVEVEPWPILRRVTKPEMRRVSKRKESVPWQREVRCNMEAKQAKSNIVEHEEKKQERTPTEMPSLALQSNESKQKAKSQRNETIAGFQSPPESSINLSATSYGSATTSPRAAVAQKHSCGWKDSILNLNAEFNQLNSELDSYDDEENITEVQKNSQPSTKASPARAHDCDDTGIEGLTIIIHLKGKDDLVINTSLRD